MFNPNKLFSKKRVSEFFTSETLIKVAFELVWLWVSIDIKSNESLDCKISKVRNKFVKERFLSSIVKEYGQQLFSNDGGPWYPPRVCRFLKLKHCHIHSLFEKSIIEKTIQFIKDRIESFVDYFPIKKKKNCKLNPVMNWLNLFTDFHNYELILLK